MSPDRLKVPRGTFDVLPEDSVRRNIVEQAARKVFGRAGYGRIETPTFEGTELFARGVGEHTDIVQKEMYSFDDGGGRSMTLRPEGTAPICRAYIQHGMHKLPQPVRLWYLGSFYRHEAPQAGRYRQFWQVGVEAIGSDDPILDAEAIVLLAELLESLPGASLEKLGLRLRIGSLGSMATRAEYREQLVAFLREHEKSLSQEVQARIDSSPLRAFDSADPATKEVMANAPRLLDFLKKEDKEHFETVLKALDSVGVTYEVDSTLVRGLDYYTRTVFEFVSDKLGAQSGVGGGGRYDGLVEQLGGPSVAGIGWAAGIERITLAWDSLANTGEGSHQTTDLYVAYEHDSGVRETAFWLLKRAWDAGLHAQIECSGRSLKGQLKHANRLNSRYVAIVGGTGSGNDAVALKDMAGGGQQELPVEDTLGAVLEGLKR